MGGAPRAGQFYAPTLFKGVRSEMSIAREEIFGPVLAIQTFRSEDEAITLANGTEYGLAPVWTRDFARAMRTVRQIRAGRCWINSTIDGAPEVPIGGYKASGLGRELGRNGFDEYSQIKGIHATHGQTPSWA